MVKHKKENNSNTNAQKQYIPSLKKIYDEEIVQKLKNTFNYSNVMEVPKLQSISLNIGLGDAKNNSKGLESTVQELTLITGQKPIITKAKKDISNFKIRKGWPVGCCRWQTHMLARHHLCYRERGRPC